MLIAGDEDTRAVYTVNSSGGVHKIDGTTDGVDSIITQIGGSQSNIQVDASMTTRMISGGQPLSNQRNVSVHLGRKKWKEWDMHIESSAYNSSNATFSAITENNDAIIGLSTLEAQNGGVALVAGGDISLRGRFGNPRAYGIQFKIDTTLGRPKTRAINFSGSQSFNSTSNAE